MPHPARGRREGGPESTIINTPVAVAAESGGTSAMAARSIYERRASGFKTGRRVAAFYLLSAAPPGIK